jgi:hypothetical protein
MPLRSSVSFHPSVPFHSTDEESSILLCRFTPWMENRGFFNMLFNSLVRLGHSLQDNPVM